MKTKFLLMAATALCISVSAFSQVGRPSFGLRAGVNFQNLNGKDAEGDKLENKLKVGFNAGVNADIPVAEDFYIQPGLLYTTKGARDESGFGNEDAKINLSYVELPINLVYKPLLGEGHLLMGFGPYIAYALGGNVKVGGTETDIEFKNEVTAADYLSNPVVMKRFDAGANLLFGYEFNRRLSAQLNAQLGLLNLNPKVSGSSDDLGTLKNTGFGVSLGYRF